MTHRFGRLGRKFKATDSGLASVSSGVPGEAGDAALLLGNKDGRSGKHRNPYSPNSFQRKIYEQGFEEGIASRRYGARDESKGTPSQEAEFSSKPAVTYQSGYGSMMADGSPPTAPMESTAMEITMPPNRMLEPHRQGEQSRMLWHQTGRRFGNPPPGWIGAGGVAQIPHPNSGMRREPDRSFGPGLSAGQGGVQSFEGGGAGPMAVQTYGSLGYASMGDGSMDMAVRQGRRFSGLFCPPGHYLHCHGGLDCHCVKGARAWKFWQSRPSPLDPQGAPAPSGGMRVRSKSPAKTRTKTRTRTRRRRR